MSQEDQAKLEAVQKELSQAKADVQTLQSHHAQELAALTAAHKTALNDVQQDLAAVHTDLDTLKGEKAQWQAKHAATTQDAATAHTTLAQLRQQVDAQQGELTQLRTRYQHAAQHIETLKAKQTGLETEAAARTATFATVQQVLAQTQAESTQWEAKYTEAAQTLASAQARVQALQSDRDRMHQARSQQDARRQQATAHLHMLSDQTSKLLQDMMPPDSLLVEQQEDHLIIRIGANAAYWSGTASLKREGTQVLQALAGLLKEFPDHGVRIVGHTDPLPINKTYQKRWPTNWELSTARAAAVARYLEQHDVSPERLSIIGFSFHWPLASNDTPEGRRQNRRVEISVVPPVKP